MSKAGKSTSKVLSSWTPLNNEESNKKVYYERRELFCKWVSGVNIWRSKFLPKMKPMHFADIVSYDWPCVSPNQVTCKNPAKREDSSFPHMKLHSNEFLPIDWMLYAQSMCEPCLNLSESLFTMCRVNRPDILSFWPMGQKIYCRHIQTVSTNNWQFSEMQIEKYSSLTYMLLFNLLVWEMEWTSEEEDNSRCFEAK